MEVVLLRQICIMFLLVGIGIFLIKLGYLSNDGTKDLGTILLRIVIPSVIIKSYITEYSHQRLLEQMESMLLTVIALGVAIIIGYLIFGTRQRIENAAVIFSNVGFIGIPLIQSALGDGALFYLAPLVAIFNIFQWTYGVYVMTGNKRAIQIKAILTNPVVLAFVIGFCLFCLQIPVPSVISGVLNHVASMNTPLAMLILGTYASQVNWKEMFLKKSVYACTFVRLVLIPVITLAILSLIPGIKTEIKLVVLLATCTPVGSNIAIFAKQYDGDYQLSVATVCFSTLACIVTIPVYYIVTTWFI